MIGKAGMICGLCMIAGGVIGGLLGAKEQGYELGSAACIVIMDVAVPLNQKLRQSQPRLKIIHSSACQHFNQK